MQDTYADFFDLEDDLFYLNHAAVAPWPKRASEAVARFAEENARLGAARYPHWLTVERRLKEALATLIQAAPDDVALVKNTSEGLSLVAYGLDWRAGDNIVTSNQEFPSNRIVWESLSQFGVELRQVDLNAGASPEAALLEHVDERTRLLTISSVEYASGLRLDLETLGQGCRARDVLFCIDAIQSVGALQFDVNATQADFVIADGHKWLLGPEGLGLFYCRPAIRERVRVLQYGWHMVDPLGDYDSPTWQITPTARRFECGSPNMLCIHALEASVGVLLELGMQNVEAAVLNNASYLMARVNEHPRLELLTDSRAGRYAGIVTFRPQGFDVEALAKLHRRLMARRVICASRGGGIRFSPHFHTSHAVLDQALAILDDCLE